MSRKYAENETTKKVYDFINKEILKLPDEELPQSYKIRVNKAFIEIKEYDETFKFGDMIDLYKSCDKELSYVTIKFENKMHELNTILKVMKNRIIDMIKFNQYMDSDNNLKYKLIKLHDNKFDVTDGKAAKIQIVLDHDSKQKLYAKLIQLKEEYPESKITVSGVINSLIDVFNQAIDLDMRYDGKLELCLFPNRISDVEKYQGFCGEWIFMV